MAPPTSVRCGPTPRSCQRDREGGDGAQGFESSTSETLYDGVGLRSTLSAAVLVPAYAADGRVTLPWVADVSDARQLEKLRRSRLDRSLRAWPG